MIAVVSTARELRGIVAVPGDKSISHRALIFAALAEGTCRIEGIARGADVLSTATCLRALGVRIDDGGEAMIVHGVGLHGLRTPQAPLDCGNSGTTMRLLAGVLAGSGVGGTLTGDESLRGRPMRRVLDPLRAMGAGCSGEDGHAPLHFTPGAKVRGIDHVLPVASAQVKSALLLAGLWAEGTTTVTEPGLSRDHTERMLRDFGASIASEPTAHTASAPGDTAPNATSAHTAPDATVSAPTASAPNAAARARISIRAPASPLRAPATLRVPGDPSSAAFLLGAALLVPGGDITTLSIDTNPTRTGFLAVLARMGATVAATPRGSAAGDPVADLHAGHARLEATTIAPWEIPALVDEIPLLATLATQAHGTTEIRGAAELRIKESDRLTAIATGLRAMGGDIDELEDGLRIRGPTPLTGAAVHSRGDHRIAMSLVLAGLAASGETTVDDASCTDVSFPGFFPLLSRLTGGAIRLPPTW